MDRTEHSLKAFIGLNRALDTLEKNRATRCEELRAQRDGICSVRVTL